MLVLSRRVAEKISIPELGITLEVVSIKGNTVRLGIDAPPEIRIMRSEIMDDEGIDHEANEQSGSAPLNRFLEKKPVPIAVNESRVGYMTRTTGSGSLPNNGSVAV